MISRKGFETLIKKFQYKKKSIVFPLPPSSPPFFFFLSLSLAEGSRGEESSRKERRRRSTSFDRKGPDRRCPTEAINKHPIIGTHYRRKRRLAINYNRLPRYLLTLLRAYSLDRRSLFPLGYRSPEIGKNGQLRAQYIRVNRILRSLGPDGSVPTTNLRAPPIAPGPDSRSYSRRNSVPLPIVTLLRAAGLTRRQKPLLIESICIRKKGLS